MRTADGAIANVETIVHEHDEEIVLEHAGARLGLSARGYDRLLKVARTIADLAACERLNSAHVAEAVHYRALDKAYFRAG